MSDHAQPHSPPQPVAHGLHGDWCQPDWSAWTLNEADQLLRHYDGTGRALEILHHSPRPFSAAARLLTTTGQLVLKRHARAVRSLHSLREEHAFAAWLAARTTLVTPPLRARDGRTAIENADWIVEVFPVAPGFDLYQQAMSWTPYRSADHAWAAGRALAELHAATQGYAADARGLAPLITSFTLPPAQHPAAALRSYCAARPRLRQWLASQNGEQEFLQRFLPWQQSLRQVASDLPLPRQGTTNPMMTPLWTHNDWHGSNLLWSSDDEHAHVTSVIDFGLADRTCAALDVATALERSVIDWLALGPSSSSPALVDSAQAAALLTGYEHHRPMTRQERRVIAAMLPIAHCEFALSETDYFLSVLGDEARAQVAWSEYCLGHMDWFGHGVGAQMMEWMQAWAEGQISMPSETRMTDETRVPDPANQSNRSQQ